MKRNCLYIFFFLILSLCDCAAQDAIDSLKLALKNAKHDTTRCNILSQLTETASDEEWPGFNKQLKELAEKNLSSAPPNLRKTYLKHFANALHNTAYIYETEGKIKEALDFYTRSLKIQEQIGNKDGMAYSLNDMAVIYDRQGNIQTALDYYNRSLKIREETGAREAIARILNNIGCVYNAIGQPKEALGYFQRSFKIQEEIGDKYALATTLTNIGFIHIRQKEWKEALQYTQQGLKVHEELANEPGISNSLNNIGLIYEMTGETKKGLQFFERSLKIREKYNDKKGIAESIGSIAKNYLDQGQHTKALEYARKAFKISKELGYPESIQLSAKVMSVVYEKQGKGMQALEMYKLHVQMQDSLKNRENQKTAFRKEAQYKYEKQRAEDSVVTLKNMQVKNAEIEKHQTELDAKKTQQYYLFCGLGLVIVFAGFMYNRFKTTQKQKQIIEEQKSLVETQKHLVEEKQKEILDSIKYAKRIQTALLPNEKYIERKLKR